MSPLLLLGLLGVGAVLLAKPPKPKRAPPIGITQEGKLVSDTGLVIERPISTLDLVRLATAVVQKVPTPFYPSNVERLNDAVIDFNNADITEGAMRYEAYQALWNAALIGLDSSDRRIRAPLGDLSAHLERAKRGDFFPDIEIKGGAKKGIYKPWDYWGKDKDQYIAEYWPMYLGGRPAVGYERAVPGRSGDHFLAQVAVALVGDPLLTVFPDVRERSLQLLNSFVAALTIPACVGVYDGHEYSVTLQRQADEGRRSCTELVEWGTRNFRDALKSWRDGRGLGAQLPDALLPQPFQEFNGELFAAVGSVDDQLALIELLTKELYLFLVQKFTVWPGGPAPSPYVDWGWIALFYIKAIGVAAAVALTAGAALPGLYGLALEAEEKAQEWQKGEAEAGPAVTAEQVAAAGYGVAQTVSQ